MEITKSQLKSLILECLKEDWDLVDKKEKIETKSIIPSEFSIPLSKQEIDQFGEYFRKSLICAAGYNPRTNIFGKALNIKKDITTKDPEDAQEEYARKIEKAVSELSSSGLIKLMLTTCTEEDFDHMF